ncbi:unnamed protein product [Sphagnum compactum]
MAAGIWQVLKVLAAAGAVRHDELVRTAQESFKNLSTNPITAGELVEKEPAFFTGSEVRSELAQKIGANDLAESVMAFNTNYSDAGLFGVYAVAKLDHLDDLAYVIMHEMARMIYRVDSDDAGHALDVDTVKRVATRFIFDKVKLTACSCIWEDNVKVCK